MKGRRCIIVFTSKLRSRLANAFSLQITDLRTYIDIIDFVKADVKLRSFDIIDTRAVSTDYVFKKVFCPIVDMNESLADWKAHAVTRRTDKKIDEELMMKNKDMTALESEEEKGEIKKRNKRKKRQMLKIEMKDERGDIPDVKQGRKRGRDKKEE